MHLVVDCANGATSFLARPLFEGLGARVTAINDQPDGRNINRELRGHLSRSGGGRR